jgi:hypothetical protein
VEIVAAASGAALPLAVPGRRGRHDMTATVRWTDDSGTRDETFLLSTRC